MNTPNSRTVLIVDDEEVVRLAYLRSLKSARCEADAVPDGLEALRAMERQPYDVVVLDLRMPGMDGMSVLRTIKERWPESEVIIITGYPSVETAKEAVRLGAHGYLAKPVGPDDVIRAASAAMLQKQWALHRDAKAGKSNRSAIAGSARRAQCAAC